jgi:hypothetical protein
MFLAPGYEASRLIIFPSKPNILTKLASFSMTASSTDIPPKTTLMLAHAGYRRTMRSNNLTVVTFIPQS